MKMFYSVAIIFVLTFLGILIFESLYSATATYTFSGIANPSTSNVGSGGETQHNTNVQLIMDVAETEATTQEYSSMTVSDNVRWNWNTTTLNYYPVEDIVFKINEAVADITQLDWKWEGYGCRSGPGCDGAFEASVYIWNITNSTYVFIGSHTTSTDLNVNYSTTTNISSFISATSTVTLRAHGPKRAGATFPCNIRTDYAELVVTYTAASGKNTTKKNYNIIFGKAPKKFKRTYMPGHVNEPIPVWED